MLATHMTVVLDNASVHAVKAFKPLIKLLKDKSLIFYFLPPYGPKLNRIEILWRKAQHELMSFNAQVCS